MNPLSAPALSALAAREAHSLALWRVEHELDSSHRTITTDAELVPRSATNAAVRRTFALLG